MPKFKCPKCETIFDEAPKFCPTCGVEFFPPEVPHVEAKETKEEVSEPKPEVVEVKQEAQEIKQEPAEVKEEVPENKEPFHVKSLIGFIFGVAAILIIAYNVSDTLLPMGPTSTIMLRFGIGIGSSLFAFAFGIVATALSGKGVKRIKAFSILAKIFGVIAIILGIILLLAWVAGLLAYLYFDVVESWIGNDPRPYIEQFLYEGLRMFFN